ncbi:polysaccharide deacetylase family protein [Micromonosporaceae bacterium Da 78-11]
MRLSRSKKVVLLGTALLTIGLAGRAAADTTSASSEPSPTASAPAAAPQAKPPKSTAPTALPVPAKNVHHVARPNTGPAGSRMTTGSKAVALTFDDGPDPVQTPKILKLLADQHVHATFCLVGRNVRRHPELVRQIVAGGHTLCDHSWNHSLKLGKQSPAKIRADLRRTNDAITKAAPGAKVKYFRAPGGNFTPSLVGIAEQMGMTSIYWKVDPRDWDHPKGETQAAHRARVIKKVEKRTRAGAIVLSHDYGQPDTIAAYRTLLPWLRHRYHLIPLP